MPSQRTFSGPATEASLLGRLGNSGQFGNVLAAQYIANRNSDVFFAELAHHLHGRNGVATQAEERKSHVYLKLVSTITKSTERI
jgi:hypothetical protein